MCANTHVEHAGQFTKICGSHEAGTVLADKVSSDKYGKWHLALCQQRCSDFKVVQVIVIKSDRDSRGVIPIEIRSEVDKLIGIMVG